MGTGESGPQILSPALLDGYLARLTSAGLRLAQILEPGLSEDEIDALTRPLGLRLPLEARVWFGWHNGHVPTGFDEEIAPAFKLLSLQQAVEGYMQTQAAHDEGMAEPGWFPIVRSYAFVVCDCSVAEGAATPVRVLEWQLDPAPAEPKASSLGEMILLWSRCWDSGAWYAEGPTQPQRRRSHPDQRGHLNYLVDV